MDLLIRNMEPYTVEKLNEMARKRHMSRNELIRRYLDTFAAQESLVELETKYENLVQILADKLEQNNDLFYRSTEALEKCCRIINSKGDNP